MGTFDGDRLENALVLARALVAQLEPISGDVVVADPFALRLAQAHALGLVDQLAEMARPRISSPPARPSIPVADTGPFDDELLNV